MSCPTTWAQGCGGHITTFRRSQIDGRPPYTRLLVKSGRRGLLPPVWSDGWGRSEPNLPPSPPLGGCHLTNKVGPWTPNFPHSQLQHLKSWTGHPPPPKGGSAIGSASGGGGPFGHQRGPGDNLGWPWIPNKFPYSHLHFLGEKTSRGYLPQLTPETTHHTLTDVDGLPNAGNNSPPPAAPPPPPPPGGGLAISGAPAAGEVEPLEGGPTVRTVGTEEERRAGLTATPAPQWTVSTPSEDPTMERVKWHTMAFSTFHHKNRTRQS